VEWSVEYERIVKTLGIDPDGDRKATAVLDEVLSAVDNDFSILDNIVRGRRVIVFGCGPSLVSDIRALKSQKILGDYVLVAADGSVKALLNAGLMPHVNVTDLDGDEDAILEANRKGAITVVHAHGDNMPELKKLVPKMEGKVLGTTQVSPTGRVRNFMGFTDGDRAVALAIAFKAEFIVLAGMDFGDKVGEYSGRFNPKTKPKKLEIGRRLIETMASETRIPIMNATRLGVELKNVRRIRPSFLQSLLSLS